MKRFSRVAITLAVLFSASGFLVGARTVTDKTTDMWLDCGPALFKSLADPQVQQCVGAAYEPEHSIAIGLLVIGSVLVAVAVAVFCRGTAAR